MSLLGVIDRFRTSGTVAGSYQVTRSTGPGDYPDGDYVPAATSTVLITASVQPADGRSTVVIPEGVRTEDVRQLWTATELRVFDSRGDGDIIMIPGGLTAPVEPFYVFRIDGPWTMSGRSHYHVWCARRKKP